MAEKEGKKVKKKILGYLERVLEAVLSTLATVGMILVICFLLNLSGYGTLDSSEMVSVFLGSLFLTYCLIQSFVFVRYNRLDIEAAELKQELKNQDDGAQDMCEHLWER